MISIPEELLEQVERGNVLLFVGEQVVRDADGRTISERLAIQLAARCGIADADRLTFPEIAQIYEYEKGRQALVQFVHDQLDMLGDEPLPIHHYIAAMTACNLLATTCLDRRLERAFAAARPLDVIVGNMDVAFENERGARLYRLRGSVERAESLILTEDDHEAFFEQQTSISIVLQGYLARKTLLFLGYDLADPHFKRLYRKVSALLDNFARRAYAFSTEFDLKVSRWCEHHGINAIEVDAAVLLEALAHQLDARARSASVDPIHATSVKPAQLTEHPYKLLDYYEATDTAIFFGRQQESQTLASLIHGHRLVLIYGASGVGKTSLLLAGAVPLIEAADPPYHTIYVRALGDPAQIIRETLQRELPDANLPNNSTLVSFLAAATRVLGRTLVIVLDQFEEFFIRFSPQLRQAFIAELGTLYDARDVPVKVVISLREDWLAAVNEFRVRIPTVFHNDQRVLPMTRDQARQAIVAPVERLGVHYEATLVERLLDDLAGTDADVLPPQLQLVCSALYGKLSPTKRMISLAAYEQLGGARGVLRGYLDEELARLAQDKRSLARGILEELVTSQGTKAVKTGDDLALGLQIDVAKLLPVLEILVQSRLLRVLERQDGQRAFELAHEYLIREIGVGEEARERKEVEELIRQEIENWQRFQTLLAADKLARIGEVRELLRLDSEAQDLLVRSALQVGYDIDYWLSRVTDPARRTALLIEATNNKLAVVRQRAAEVLATQDVPEAVEPLLALALRDPDTIVRRNAQASLVKLTAQRPALVARLQSEVQSADRHTRQAALRTLAALPLRDLPRNLRAQIVAIRLGLRATWLAEKSTATPVRRAVAMTTGLVLALVLVAYAFALNTYSLDTKSAPILGAPNVVVIHRGVRFLPLPGVERVEVDTGISVSEDERNRLLDRKPWGFWFQRGAGGYRHWGDDAIESLLPQNRIRVLWFLNRNAAFDTLLAEARSRDPKSQGWEVDILEQIAAADPTLAPRVTEILIELLIDQQQNDTVRASAAIALSKVRIPSSSAASQIVAAFVELQYTDKLPLYPNDHTAILLKIAEANPGVTAQVVAAIFAEPDSRVLADDKLMELMSANPAAMAALADLAGTTNQDSRMRAGAALALARIAAINVTAPSPPAVDTLIEVLAGSDSQMRVLAQDAMQRLAETVPFRQATTEALIKLLSDSDDEVRVAAGLILARLRPDDRAVIETLLAQLTDPSPSALVRQGVASALGQIAETNPAIATPQLAAVLVMALSDTSLGVRNEATKALGMVAAANPNLANEQLVDVLTKRLTESESAIDPLISVGSTNPALAPKIAQNLVRRLEFFSRATPGRSSSIEALGEMVRTNPSVAPQVADALLKLKSDTDSDVRAAMASALAQVGAADRTVAPQVAETLVDLLNDPESSVGPHAAYALNLLLKANPTIAENILDLLHERLTSPDSRVRFFAAGAMRQVVEAVPGVGSQIVEPLIACLGDPEGRVRASAASTLGGMVAANDMLATPRVVSALFALRVDTDPNVRFAVADALGMIVTAKPTVATPQMVDELITLLTAKDHRVRLSAAAILRDIAKANHAAAPQMVIGLAALLDDDDLDVRSNAANALGLVGHDNPTVVPQVVEALIKPLTNQNEDDNVVLVATGSLVQTLPLDPTAATPPLRVALLGQLNNAHGQVRENAADLLETLVLTNHAVATPELADELVKLLTVTEDIDARGRVAEILASTVTANRSSATPRVIEVLEQQLLVDQHSGIRTIASAALAQISAADTTTPANVKDLLKTLTNQHYSLQRPIAARALFLVALRDPTQAGAIRNDLQSLAKSIEPHERIVANQALQLLDVADLAHIAAKDANQRDVFFDKFGAFAPDPYGEVSGYDTSAPYNLFGSDFSWAVGEAWNWVVQQTTKSILER